MMKMCVLMITMFATTPSFAAAKQKLIAEVSFSREKQKHFYQITQSTGNEPHYALIFRDELKRIHRRTLSVSEARQIQASITHMIWENEYKRRKPASMTCRPYATLRVGVEQSKVCRDNIVIMGKAYGLLNSLNRYF